jgi:hypothetical protein
VAEAVNQLDSPTHSGKLRSMLGDEGPDSDSPATDYEFILVSSECHARAGELRDNLALWPPTNAAIEGQGWSGSTLGGFRLGKGQGLGILATKWRPAATDKSGEATRPRRKLQTDNAAK